MRIAALFFPVLLVGVTCAIACSSTTTVIPAATTTSDAGEETDGEASSSSGSTSSSGSSGSSGQDAAPAGPMTLTSTAWKDGATYPTKYTCNGDETKSPPLAWTPGPDGTLSYAIVFNDKTLNFLHSAIYDIPADVTELPEGVEPKYQPAIPAGAKQALNYKSKPGYVGPCPPKPGEDTYEFTIYALKVATLPGMTQSSKTADVQTAAAKQVVSSTGATAKLTAKYKQP